MNTQSTSEHEFSDSEDEQDKVISFEEEADFIETVAKDVHEAAISKLTQELQDVRTSAERAIEKVVAERDDQSDLFKKEREEHASEMAKRQQRIDFLMDSIISR